MNGITKKQSYNRIYWVDYIKSFTMFLVVLGHSGLENGLLRELIYGFHVPMFIFVSGFFYKKPYSIKASFKKYFRTLAIPYLFFSVFIIPLQAAVHYLKDGTVLRVGEFFLKFLMDDRYACGPIWFLGALLFIKILLDTVVVLIDSSYSKGDKNKGFVILCTLILVFLLDATHVVSILSVDSSLGLLVFFLSGLFWKKYVGLSNMGVAKKIWAPILIIITYATSVYLNSTQGNSIAFVQMKIGDNPVWTYFNAMLGCVGFTMLFSAINTKSHFAEFFQRIGEYTIGILGFHIIFIVIFRFAFKSVAGENIPFWYLLVISIISYFMSYFLTRMVSKINPALIGKQKK